MNTLQASNMTGIPTDTLIRMRSRNTTSNLSGPPFHKKMGKGGEPIYEYKAAELRAWLRIKLCQITAGDAANIMGISRDEIMTFSGIKAFKIDNEYKGRLIVNNAKNMYIWLPTKITRKKLKI